MFKLEENVNFILQLLHTIILKCKELTVLKEITEAILEYGIFSIQDLIGRK